MTLLAKAIRSTGGRTLIVLLVAWLGWQLYLTLAAGGKIDPEIEQASEADAPVSVAVTLDFPPERFHTLELQEFGRVAGVEDNTVELREVAPDDVDSIARIYWVDHLGPLDLPELDIDL
ncbi:hypothetical protein CLV30_107118 [Haloactinopolyspora alba]|uniref:Uncharacterized protein n=1 Tax=Haloactinopolyspora alba TaxID=648780 RepID=A0A2P8E2L8_9ACTN|nr:hypothetical protein [Haloactinopolyspora alba]PSL03637.1 hypothetical protein CLV30_107118 [Haloactinopolyspora alba]